MPSEPLASGARPAPGRPASCGGLEEPEELGEVLPDLGALGLVVAEPEDRAGPAFGGQLGAERGDRVADGRRVAGLGQLDRQQELQRGPPVGERVEELARDEQDAPPLLRDELGEVLHLRGAEEAGVGVAEEDDVVGEQLFLGGGEGGQRRAVLLAVLGVGREEDDAQVDRLLAFQEVLEVAVLVARLAIDEQDLELLLADVDGALDPVVLGLELAGRGSTSRM